MPVVRKLRPPEPAPMRRQISEGLIVGESDGIPTPQRMLFPVNKLSIKWERVYLVGAGLYNLGNTCFLNSTVQCLTYTPPLANYLLSNEHSRSCRQSGFCMICVMQNHIIQAFANTGSAIKPAFFIRDLKKIARHFRCGSQEDAHEFLRYTIDAMQKACLNGYPKLDRETQTTTLIHQIFGGYLRSRVACLECESVSDSYEPYLDIALEIGSVVNIVQALKLFAKPDVLCRENAYMCAKCNMKVSATRLYTVHRMSNILTLSLKRFASSRGGKITRNVSYPEVLNIRPYMSQSVGDAVMYGLYAVLVHSGDSCRAGHYYCYVKASNEQWYKMNDSTVHPSTLKVVLDQQAYILFYLRMQEKNTDASNAKQDVVHSVISNVTPEQWKKRSLNEPLSSPQVTEVSPRQSLTDAPPSSSLHSSGDFSPAPPHRSLEKQLTGIKSSEVKSSQNSKNTEISQLKKEVALLKKDVALLKKEMWSRGDEGLKREDSELSLSLLCKSVGTDPCMLKTELLETKLRSRGDEGLKREDSELSLTYTESKPTDAQDTDQDLQDEESTDQTSTESLDSVCNAGEQQQILTGHTEEEDHTGVEEESWDDDFDEELSETPERDHPAANRCQCGVCGKILSQPSSLSRHKRLHTGKKPYKCSQCDKCFTNKSSLRAHKSVHTGEKPYSCSQCGKRFSDSSNLKAHQKLHTGHKPYHCDVCGKSFSRLDYLVQHKRIHNCEKPYKCSQCDKTFTQSAHLRAHKRVHTGKKP
ncbi:uncharacterized protein [Paramisgurnus dabryanus]|uniref:uncharacterized protein n=1 Tax=Paramisgurnus dabryanus TaxID=90735 RepID=UPI003CCFA91F